jgi:hypothetical protein
LSLFYIESCVNVFESIYRPRLNTRLYPRTLLPRV